MNHLTPILAATLAAERRRGAASARRARAFARAEGANARRPRRLALRAAAASQR
jgi:hypothetical protein